jgi:hypothetical protein
MYATASYVLVVAGVFVWTLYHTKPECVGYDWIPLYLLAMPGLFVNFGLLAGLTLNAGLIYLLGAVIGALFDERQRR